MRRLPLGRPVPADPDGARGRVSGPAADPGLQRESDRRLRGCLRYLRWDFTGDDALEFQAGSCCAFVVGFETPGPERGFTLANRNTASVDAPPALGDSHDAYMGGWAVRREGDGTLPPFMSPSPVAPREAGLRKRLVGESMFESGEGRFSLSPTTAGYPDVDTYRDYEFYLEASAEQEADGGGGAFLSWPRKGPDSDSPVAIRNRDPAARPSEQRAPSLP